MPLLVVVDAAEREPEREAGVRAEDFRVAMDLDRQLARWSDDQRARRIEIARRRRRLPDQARVHRDQKRRGLSRSCLRLARHIESGERLRQRLRLDGGAAFERCVREPFLHSLRQMQARKGKFG